MVDTIEIRQRILAELEEAHAENVPCTMNTVWPPTGQPDELSVFQEALTELIQAGFITFGYEPPKGGRLALVLPDVALETAKSLPSLVHFDPDRGILDWDPSEPWAEIVATKSGLIEARKILGERGYQWWRDDQ